MVLFVTELYGRTTLFFSRLAAWNTNNPSRISEGLLLHLQVGLLALFNRLYGMYPYSFLNHLRQLYSLKDNYPIFNHTIMVSQLLFEFYFS